MKQHPFATVDDLIPLNDRVAAVPGIDSLISHVADLVVANLCIGIKTKRDTDVGRPMAGNFISKDLVAGTKAKFDGIVQRVSDYVILNHVVVTAAKIVRLDENAATVLSGDRIVPNNVVVRSILKNNCTCIATGTDHTTAPGAVAHIVLERVSRHFAVLRVEQVDAPRGIIHGGVIADEDGIAVPDIDSDRFIVRLVVLDPCALNVFEMNATAFGQPQKVPIAAAIRIVVVVREIIIMNIEVRACVGEDAGETLEGCAVSDLDIIRCLQKWKAILANQKGIALIIQSLDAMSIAIDHHVTRLDDHAIETFRLGLEIVRHHVIAGLPDLGAIAQHGWRDGRDGD